MKCDVQTMIVQSFQEQLNVHFLSFTLVQLQPTLPQEPEKLSTNRYKEANRAHDALRYNSVTAFKLL